MMHLFKSSLIATLLCTVSQLVEAQLGGVITVNCAPLTVQRSDPVVSPGVASGHVHAITGGTAFQRTMSANTAANARATTCDKILDKSNYWVPQLYHIRSDGKFEIVKMQGNAAYYLDRACDYAAGLKTCGNSKYSLPPPAGLRMLSGNPALRTYNANDITQRAIQHVCLANAPVPDTPGLPKTNCLRIRSEVSFPPCWNGRDLDSSDHKSHMAFPAIGDYNGGVCPSTHPIAIMQVFYEFFYDTAPYADHKFVYANGDVTGYGLHGDFVNGWTDQTALGNAFSTCTGPQGIDSPSCSLNAGKAPGSASDQLPEVPAKFEEEIGLNGPIAALPGNNPVTGTPPAKRSRFRGRSVV